MTQRFFGTPSKIVLPLLWNCFPSSRVLLAAFVLSYSSPRASSWHWRPRVRCERRREERLLLHLCFSEHKHACWRLKTRYSEVLAGVSALASSAARLVRVCLRHFPEDPPARIYASLNICSREVCCASAEHLLSPVGCASSRASAEHLLQLAWLRIFCASAGHLLWPAWLRIFLRICWASAWASPVAHFQGMC